jgi:hypothetical protein
MPTEILQRNKDLLTSGVTYLSYYYILICSGRYIQILFPENLFSVRNLNIDFMKCCKINTRGDPKVTGTDLLRMRAF